jgi:hypothetical protein
VTRIKVFEVGSTDKPGNFKNLKLLVGGSQVGATVPAYTVSTATDSSDGMTADYVLFEDQTSGLFTVSKNTSKTLTLQADITDDANASFADAGTIQVQRVKVVNGTVTATADISAKGSTSGAFVTLAGGAASATSTSSNLDSNEMRVVKTKPTFALVSPSSTTLVPATDQEVYRFRITAHSNEDVKFVSGTSNIRFTMSGSPTTATAFDWKLFDAGSGLQLGPTISTATASAGTISFTTFGSGATGGDLTVPKSTTKEFYVKASLNNFSAVGNTFKLSIENRSADFSWSDDSSGTADIEDDDYTGLGLPLAGATFVKP